jgi:hypothetical protein
MPVSPEPLPVYAPVMLRFPLHDTYAVPGDVGENVLFPHCISRLLLDAPQLELVASKAQGATVPLGVPLLVTKNGVEVASGK